VCLVIWVGCDHTLTIHKLSLISSSFLFFTMHHFPSFLRSCVLLFPFFVSILFFFPFMLFNFHTLSSSSLYIVFFLFSPRSEPSHLLNHLVKFVSSGNLLWVSHHTLLKTKSHKQSVIIKCVILKSTQINMLTREVWL